MRARSFKLLKKLSGKTCSPNRCSCYQKHTIKSILLIIITTDAFMAPSNATPGNQSLLQQSTHIRDMPCAAINTKLGVDGNKQNAANAKAKHLVSRASGPLSGTPRLLVQPDMMGAGDRNVQASQGSGKDAFKSCCRQGWWHMVWAAGQWDGSMTAVMLR